MWEDFYEEVAFELRPEGENLARLGVEVRVEMETEFQGE